MSLFGSLQRDAAAQLRASQFFSDAGNTVPRPISVIHEQLKDIQNQIALATGKLGIITVVLTVSGRMSNPNRTKPYFEDIKLVARTYENVMVNRSPSGSGQSATHVAESCALILHGWTPAGLQSALFCTDVLLVDHPHLFVWDAIFTLQAGMTDGAPIRS
jgi:hypothetical protein